MSNKETNYSIDNEMGGGGVLSKATIKTCKIAKCIYTYSKKCTFKNAKLNHIYVIDNFIFTEFEHSKN